MSWTRAFDNSLRDLSQAMMPVREAYDAQQHLRQGEQFGCHRWPRNVPSATRAAIAMRPSNVMLGTASGKSLVGLPLELIYEGKVDPNP